MKTYKDVKVGDSLYILYMTNRYEHNIEEVKVIQISDTDYLDEDSVGFTILLDGCYVCIYCIKENNMCREIMDFKGHDDLILDIYTEYESARDEIIRMCTAKIECIDAMVEKSKNSRKHHMKELERWTQISTE